MQQKWGKCIECGKECPLNAKKLCSDCVYKKNHKGKSKQEVAYEKQKDKPIKIYKKKPQKKIRSRSKKREKLDEEYNKLRIPFLEKHPKCQICNQREATQVHHTYCGSSKHIYYLVVDTWMAVCGECHTAVHDDKTGWAKRNCYLK